jgi:hypothetical protein
VYSYTMTLAPKFVILSFVSNVDTPQAQDVARVILENLALELMLTEAHEALPLAECGLVPVPGGLTPRLGFVVDIVGFGQRDAEQRDDLAHRLAALVAGLVADLGLERSDTMREVAGDSTAVFLPVGMASPYVLPRLIAAASERLARDNRRYRDRMRLRMAVGSGVLGTGPLGLTGQLVVDLHRLVDSDQLREAIAADEEADLALLVTHTVHDEVVRPGYLAGKDFTPVEITTKEFAATAWLRLC